MPPKRNAEIENSNRCLVLCTVSYMVEDTQCMIVVIVLLSIYIFLDIELATELSPNLSSVTSVSSAQPGPPSFPPSFALEDFDHSWLSYLFFQLSYPVRCLKDSHAGTQTLEEAHWPNVIS